MELVKIIEANDYETYVKNKTAEIEEEMDDSAMVGRIIAKVRAEGDKAVRHYTAQFDKSVPENFEVPMEKAREAWECLKTSDPQLASSLSLAADNIRRFSSLQKGQFRDFEEELQPGLFTGQRIIPVEKAAIYVPGGRFPLVSSALMALIPAAVAGVKEKILVSPPREWGFPDLRIMAAAYIAGADRIFTIGGAQAIAALALGTETIPRVDLIAGPGNKYVVMAKRMLFGEVGIDFLPGPSDVLIVAGKGEGSSDQIAKAAGLVAVDMLAQAEHDPDARSLALVPSREFAEAVKMALEKDLSMLPTAEIARASLQEGGLIIVYSTKEEAVKIANRIAPEHLELHVSAPETWVEGLRNYGSLFMGAAAAEVLGDYSAGINHTLPTLGTARFTGGLSVRNFLKAVTTLRCEPGGAYFEALSAAETIARAEGLRAHAESAAIRLRHGVFSK